MLSKTLTIFLLICFVSGCQTVDLPVSVDELHDIPLAALPDPEDPQGYTAKELALMFLREAADNCTNVEGRMIANGIILKDVSKVKIPKNYAERCQGLTNE